MIFTRISTPTSPSCSAICGFNLLKVFLTIWNRRFQSVNFATLFVLFSSKSLAIIYLLNQCRTWVTCMTPGGHLLDGGADQGGLVAVFLFFESRPVVLHLERHGKGPMPFSNANAPLVLGLLQTQASTHLD